MHLYYRGANRRSRPCLIRMSEIATAHCVGRPIKSLKFLECRARTLSILPIKLTPPMSAGDIECEIVVTDKMRSGSIFHWRGLTVPLGFFIAISAQADLF